MTGSPALDNDEAPLTVRLFGPFDARVHGEPLPRLRSRKGAWLLALLMLRAGRTVQRSWLAGTLWSESEEGDALYSLRRSLSDLRAALGPEAVRIQSPTPQTLRFDAEGCWIDVLAFDAGVGAADEKALADAVDLYRGPLLEGCNEDWCLSERAAREEALLSALEQLASLAHQRSDWAAEVHRLRRLLAVDPYRESAAGALMEAHAQMGDFAAAVRAFLDFRKTLKRELGTEPSAGLFAKFEDLQQSTRTLTAPPSAAHTREAPRLPQPLTPLLGRELEIRATSELLNEYRLVTLAGAGGIGKTRLALGVGDSLRDQFSRVLFADLSSVRGPDSVPRVLMNAVGAWEQPREPGRGDLVRMLSTSPTLLIVDNCEHLVEGLAPLLAEVLRSCPELKVLATSRQALQISGEQLFWVSALTVEADDSPAVRLFVHYARSADPSFRSSGENEAAIVAICRRLEGIPLALELAATQVRLLSPKQILARLDDRLTLLAGGSRDAPERHRTLRAALAWSYDLLDVSEQRLFRRLSLLVGSWDLAAASTLGGGEVEEQLMGLIGKSLVIAENQGADRRFHMLETLREYGLERLDEHGEKQAAQEALVGWAVELAESASQKLRTPAQREALQQLDAAYPNLRTALVACRSDGITDLRLCAALWRFWDLRGHWSEGLRFLSAATPETFHEMALAAEALLGIGVLRRRLGDLPGSEAALSQSLAIWRKLESAYGIAAALHEQGLVALLRGDLAEADILYCQSWNLAEQEGDLVHLAALANDRGELARARGQLDEAETLYARCLDISRRLEDVRGMAGALANLGNLAAERGEFDEAVLWGEQSLEHLSALRDRWGRALVLNNLGFAHLGFGDPAVAQPLFREAAELRRNLGDLPGLAHSFAGLSAAATLANDDENAAVFAGAVDSLREGEGVVLDPVDLRLWEPRVATTRARLGEAAFRKAWRRGRYADRQTLLDAA